jgi:hypothetical protein
MSLRKLVLGFFVLACPILPAAIVRGEPGPIAYWSFDSVEDNSYSDITGHGYNAVSAGSGLSLVSGVKGNAINCPQSGYDLYAVNSKDSFAVQSVTVEAWYYATSLSTSKLATIYELSYLQSGIHNGYNLFINPTGIPYFVIASGGTWVQCASPIAIAAGRWYHIVGSYDKSYLRLYVNGELEGTVSRTGSITYPVGQDARIGCQKLIGGTIQQFANGRIDELRLYNYALSPDSIRAHFLREAPSAVILIPCVPNPTYERKPTFRWYSKSSISVYRFQLSSSQSFSNMIVSVPQTDTFFTPSANLAFGTVFWRVSNDADTSLWANISSLTIQDTTVPILMPYLPDPTRNRRPTLTWHHVTSATSYTIQINTTSSFVSPFVSTLVSDTFYTLGSNLPVGRIFWHVKSNLGDQYSLPDTFQVLNDSIPVLIPVYPDTQSIRKPLLRWYSGTGATSYRLQIDTVGDFSNPYVSLPVTDTVYTPSVDLPHGKIFWRVSTNSNPNLYSPADTFWIINTLSAQMRSSRASSNGVVLFSTRQRDNVRIGYTLEQPSAVSLRVFSITGQCVATLVRDARAAAGTHSVEWKTLDNQGKPLPNGSYILVCRQDEKLATGIILLTR